MRGAFIMLRPANRGAPAVMVFSSGGGSQVKDDGTFSVSNVAPGEYVIETAMRGDDAEFAMTPITVGSDDITGVALLGTKGATVKGQIVTDTNTPPTFSPDDVQIFAASDDFSGPMRGGGRADVHDDWTFEMEGLIGRPRIYVNRLPAGWYVKSVLADDVDITDAPLDLRGSSMLSGVQIVLSNRAAEVTGGVSDEKGQPVKEYSVLLFASNADLWGRRSRYIQTARPDQDGKFSIKSLPPETYLAIALDYIPDGEWNNPEFLEEVREKATKVLVAEGEVKGVGLRIVKTS